MQQARPTTPIVTGAGDPVGSGFADTIERPGRNITGLSWGLREKARKQVGLLLELVPTAQALVVPRSRRYGDIPELNACLEDAAREHGLAADIRTVESLAEIEAAFESHAGPLKAAVIIYGHGPSQFDEAALMQAAIRNRIAPIGDERRAVETGCLMSFQARHANQERVFAAIVDRVLRGERPATIPFALPDQSELAVNRNTAAALGVELSTTFLERADLVIS